MLLTVKKMVRNYIKKGLRQSWSEESMRTALEAVIQEGYSVKRASNIYKVPHATLSRKVNQCRLDPGRQCELLANPKAMNLQTVFNKEQENILCNYIAELESANVALVGTDVRHLAFQLAEKFNLPHRFKKDTGLAGEDWYRGFLKRNPHVKLKRGDTPYEKSRVFSKEKVYKFFDSLENLIVKYDLKPSDLYNLDETVITCSCKSTQDSEESALPKDCVQNKLVTALISFSASGVYVPLLMVFPDKVKNKPLLHGAPPTAWALVNTSGQMQLDIFIRWLLKFIDFKKPTPADPVLLLIDRYHSYLKDIEVLEIMTKHGVHVLCLPPYCASKLHPLKHSFMEVLSKTYQDEVTNSNVSSAGQFVSVDEVFKLFGDAFMKVSSTAAAGDSFLNTGIWPVNRNLFKDDFITVTLTLNASSIMNDSQSASESPASVADEEYQHIDSSTPVLHATPILHEPMIVISQNNNQLYEIQGTNQVDQSYEHSVQQGHFLQIVNESMENVILENHNPSVEGSIVIPPEAELTEVQFQDLEFLAQSQRKLYFYVSPHKLKLS